MRTGKKVWLIPDGFRPEEGSYSERGHEALMILNAADEPADIRMTVFFENRDPIIGKHITVGPRRVRGLRTNKLEDLDGFVPNYHEKYALLFESNVDITIQYGVLDPTDLPMHLYTVMGYPIE